jgi:uncharacterized OB-fold protein
MAQRRPDRTLGPGHDEFWAWCAKGELRLQRCSSCGRISWPVVEACEFCGCKDMTWAPMSGRGKIAGWCTFERDYYSGVLPMPWDTILVELDEGPLFLSNPKGFGWPEAKVGMPVKLALIECEDSAGIFRLPVFEKAS